MRRISHSTWASIIEVASVGLLTNLLVTVCNAPLVLLLITTDPARSWPLLAVAALLSAPAFAAAFATFRAHALGERSVIRCYLHAWRTLFGKAAAIGAAAIAIVVVALVDVRMLSDTAAAVLVVPVLFVVAAVTLGTAVVALVALAEAPQSSLWALVRASAFLSLRHWYLTAVSLAIIAVQCALFTQAPALALGLTAAPALYVAWAGSRFSLRSVLGPAEARA